LACKISECLPFLYRKRIAEEESPANLMMRIAYKIPNILNPIEYRKRIAESEEECLEDSIEEHILPIPEILTNLIWNYKKKKKQKKTMPLSIEEETPYWLLEIERSNQKKMEENKPKMPYENEIKMEL